MSSFRGRGQVVLQVVLRECEEVARGEVTRVALGPEVVGDWASNCERGRVCSHMGGMLGYVVYGYGGVGC